MAGYSFIPVQPQITEANIITDTSEEWVLISGFYIAQGGEQFLTIGNFYDDNHTLIDTMSITGNTQPFGYYYIDDVSLKWCSGVGINEVKKKDNRFKLYPNPNNGMMELDYSLEENKTGKLEIYSITGQPISIFNLRQGKNTLQINEVELSNGIYFYCIFVNDNIVKRDKLVILK
jgi:hypothetical protein